MELLELTQKIKELFDVDDLADLGPALKNVVMNADEATMDKFVELVGGDLEIDWLQKVYQYYLADRKDKKQDYTPKCLAEFLSLLVGITDTVVDLCAGSGALAIQHWARNKDQKFVLYEIDAGVVPFLLFNLAVRNINATVYVGDALAEEYDNILQVRKGVKYGRVSRLESSL